MTPLRVAVVHAAPRPLLGRNAGAWSYPVPEFDAVSLAQESKTFHLNRDFLRDRYDLVVQEDHKVWGHFPGAGLPVCYWITDSTLSLEHYQQRRTYVEREPLELLLLDWDRADRWADLGVPVRRFAHCVNDRRFHPQGEKTVDVNFSCGRKSDYQRQSLHLQLMDFCRANGWVYDGGVYPGDEYARALARAKVVVNLNRTPDTRNHRLFDAMACCSAVLTSIVPEVEGEQRQAGRDYLEWHDWAECRELLHWLIAEGEWETYAAAGYQLVQDYHTWTMRARQLRQTLGEVFPWLN